VSTWTEWQGLSCSFLAIIDLFSQARTHSGQTALVSLIAEVVGIPHSAAFAPEAGGAIVYQFLVGVRTMKRFLHCLFCICVCVPVAGEAIILFGPGPAYGAVLQYTDRTLFDGAATNLQTITFEGLASVNSLAFFNSPPGLTLLDVNFQSKTNRLFIVDPGWAGQGEGAFYWNSGQYLHDNAYEGIIVQLPLGITAMGCDISGWGDDPMIVTLATGAAFTFAHPRQPNYGFAGFTSNEPITSLFFHPSGDITTLDNFTFGQSVPEPSSLVLLCVGAIGLLAWAWRRRLRCCNVETWGGVLAFARTGMSLLGFLPSYRRSALVAVLGCVAILHVSVAQLSGAVIQALFNTGMDNNGVVLGDGSVDPHYTLIAAPNASGYGPNAFVVNAGYPIGPGGWFANSPI
jgi:hypothetical protein